MDLIDLNGDGKFLFFSMMQAAIKMHDLGKTEQEFLDFAKGIWETLEMNDKEQLFSLIQESMLEDVKSFAKS